MKKRNQESQAGGAGVKFLAVAVVLFLIGNAGYNFIPAAYSGASFKQEMQAAVSQGMTLPPSAGNPIEFTKKRLQTVAKVNNVPAYALIEVKSVSNLLQARVAYIKPIPILPFGIYNYDYEFDYTANASGFFNKQ